MEEGVVYMESDVVVVVGVASKQKGTGVTVKGVVDKPHRTGHCGHNNLGGKNGLLVISSIHLNLNAIRKKFPSYQRVPSLV